MKDVALRRMFRVVNGGTPTADDENWDGGVPWATPVDLAKVNGGVLDATARTPIVGVARLDVFRSAASDAFDEVHSAADFVVEFVDGPNVDPFDAYFSLKEGLAALLGQVTE